MPASLIARALTAATLAMVATAALAQDSALEDRVSRLERIVSNQTGSDILMQLQQLQQDIQDLRGKLEMQEHQIQTLQTQQQQQYQDLDSRLQGASQSSSAAPALSAPATIDSAPQATPTPPANGSRVPALPAPESTSGGEREVYSHAFELLKSRKYDEARRAFLAQLQLYPNGQYADNARYWLGETYYVQGDFPSALDSFNQLIMNDPDSPKAPGALLKIGYIQADQKAFSQARATLQRVISTYPDTTEARLAQAKMDQFPQ